MKSSVLQSILNLQVSVIFDWKVNVKSKIVEITRTFNINFEMYCSPNNWLIEKYCLYCRVHVSALMRIMQKRFTTLTSKIFVGIGSAAELHVAVDIIV